MHTVYNTFICNNSLLTHKIVNITYKYNYKYSYYTFIH